MPCSSTKQVRLQKPAELKDDKFRSTEVEMVVIPEMRSSDDSEWSIARFMTNTSSDQIQPGLLANIKLQIKLH